MSEVVRRRYELSKNTKLKVVNATVIPMLMYGCEAWRIEGVNKVDRARNEVLRERLGQEGILDLVKRRKEK